MAEHRTIEIDGGLVSVAFTDRTDGDFRPLAVDADPAAAPDVAAQTHQALEGRRRQVVDASWTWLRQVHGGRSVYVTAPGDQAGAVADAALTTVSGCPLAVTTADCAPVVLVAEGGVAVAHAGWRGLVAGVITGAGSLLRAVAGEPVTALVGPCIGPGAYEFGADDLAAAVDVFGATVRGETGWGTPALDVPAAVAVACEQAGWPVPDKVPACTSDDQWYSHRTRVDGGRQATVAWLS